MKSWIQNHVFSILKIEASRFIGFFISIPNSETDIIRENEFISYYKKLLYERFNDKKILNKCKITSSCNKIDERNIIRYNFDVN